MKIKRYNQFINESVSIKIDIITEFDNDSVIDVLYNNFKNLVSSKNELKDKLKQRLNNNLSICIKKDNIIIGVYLLNKKSINEFIESINRNEISDFKKDETTITLNEELSDNGLQGIALSVVPEYQNKGYGKLLKEYTYKLGFDYIWGVQDKKLNNIDNWTKTRKIFAESPNRYATYLKLTK